MAKKKILLLSDDMRMHSGIATMSRELVLGTVKQYDWVQIAGAIQHPDKGKIINLDAATVQQTGVKDAKVVLYPVDGYGSEEILYNVIDREKPDAIMHFTDPRFWIWLYALERQLRKTIPIVYYNIWDDIPYPMYNKPYYESCDLLMSISKQTFNINKWVLGTDHCFSVDGSFDKNGNLLPNKKYWKSFIDKANDSVKHIDDVEQMKQEFCIRLAKDLFDSVIVDENNKKLTYDDILKMLIAEIHKLFPVGQFKKSHITESNFDLSKILHTQNKGSMVLNKNE